jgi:hypothetical protein
MSKLRGFFSNRKKTAATGAVMLGLLGTSVGGGITILAPPSGAVDPGTANIWVDADGGTCADNASLVAYDTAVACATLDAANDVADNGDIVMVKGGTRAPETLSGSNGRTGLATFTEPAGEDVTLGPWVHLGTTQTFVIGSSYTLGLQAGESTDGFPQDIAGDCPGVGVACYVVRLGGGSGAYFECTGKTSSSFTGCKSITNGGMAPFKFYDGADMHTRNDVTVSGDWIKIDGLDEIGSIYVSGDNNTVSNNTLIHLFDIEGDNTTMTGNLIGFVTTGAANQVGTSSPGPSNVVFNDNTITDFFTYDCGGTGAGACHVAGIHIQDLNGTMELQRNVFKRIAVFTVEFQAAAGCCIVGPVVVRNNFFDCRWGQAVEGGGSPETRTCSGTSVALDGDNTQYTFEYNSGHGNSTSMGLDGTFASTVIRGNLGFQLQSNGNNCSASGVTCRSNLWTNATFCPGTNDTGSECGIDPSAGYVDEDGMDLRLVDGAYAEANADPSSCPADDIDSNSRPLPGATTCDAGGHERN